MAPSSSRLAIAVMLMAIAVVVLTALCGCRTTTAVSEPQGVGNPLVPLSRGSDGLWKVDKGGLYGTPVAVVVTYTTGDPYPGAGTYNCEVYCRMRIVDAFGKVYEPRLSLGSLGYRGPGEHEQRFELPQGPWGTPQSIGLRQDQRGELLAVKLELPAEANQPDE